MSDDLEDLLKLMDGEATPEKLEKSIKDAFTEAKKATDSKDKEMLKILETLVKEGESVSISSEGSKLPYAWTGSSTMPPLDPSESLTLEKLEETIKSLREAEESKKKKATSYSVFAKSQALLSVKFPQAAERVRLFKNQLAKTVYTYGRVRHINDASRKTDNEYYFTVDSPKKFAVMKVANFDSFGALDLSMIRKTLMLGVARSEYAEIEGDYYTKPFLGEEVFEPIDAYIGKNGKVIFRFFELPVDGVSRTSELNEIVEVKEDAIGSLIGFEEYYEGILSAGETLSSEEEFKQLMETIKLNSSEEQGSW